jgi:hypothetical protein
MWVRVFILSIILAATKVSAAGAPADEVRGHAPSKNKNLFVYKADKNLVGGKVEILAYNGQVITSQHLQRRKMIIDFGDVQFGTYTIRVSKGSKSEEFQFTKK